MKTENPPPPKATLTILPCLTPLGSSKRILLCPLFPLLISSRRSPRLPGHLYPHQALGAVQQPQDHQRLLIPHTCFNLSMTTCKYLLHYEFYLFVSSIKISSANCCIPSIQSTQYLFMKEYPKKVIQGKKKRGREK